MLIAPEWALEVAEVKTFYVAKMIQRSHALLWLSPRRPCGFSTGVILEILAHLQQYCTTYIVLVGTSSLQILQYILMGRLWTSVALDSFSNG